MHNKIFIFFDKLCVYVGCLIFVTTHGSANLKLYTWYTSLSIKSPDEGVAVRCWHKFIHKQNIGTKLVKVYTFIWKDKMLPYKILVIQTDYLVAVPMHSFSIMHQH